MEYSKNGLGLTEQFESCRLTAYQDGRGIWTIGWGHTGPEVVEGLVWTQAQADAQLLKDVSWAEANVNTHVTVPLTQNEFDSLVDFTFNVGVGNFDGSTMFRLLNQNDLSGAALQFERWDKSAGVEVAGLLRRRQAEEALSDTNDQS